MYYHAEGMTVQGVRYGKTAITAEMALKAINDMALIYERREPEWKQVYITRTEATGMHGIRQGREGVLV